MQEGATLKQIFFKKSTVDKFLSRKNVYFCNTVAIEWEE